LCSSFKAFDRSTRELVLGWPADVLDYRQYLSELGLDVEQLEWVIAFVAKHGCLFEKWGIPRKVINLIKNLHSRSWFSYGDLDSAITVRVGGRQGCKFGATIFNSAYSLALVMLRDDLLDAGVALRLKCGSTEFWNGQSSDAGDAEDDTPIVDAAFVDDECIMLTASSPRALDIAINTLLKVIVRVYSILRLEINWKPGKTECFLRYRGKNATKRLDARRVGPSMTLAVIVPNTDKMVTVVDEYRHLGGMISADGSLHSDAQVKVSSSLCAYVPLAMKIFGSPVVSAGLKMKFMWSLILSRLLFNVHILVPTAQYTRRLNGVYMRVLRRIADKCRFERTICDAEVRKMLHMPSLDCIIMRSRLRYLSRVLRSQPPALLALLSSRPRSSTLPWTKLILLDMQTLRERVSLCSWLPDPATNPGEWTAFITKAPRVWSLAVSTLHFGESTCDRTPPPKQIAIDAIAQHVCTECHVCFSTQKGLKAHQRTKHGLRVPQRYFADKAGYCQVCGTCFHTRLRLLAHLCDTRRAQCWSRFCTDPASYTKLSQQQVDFLDQIDQDMRKQARKRGHTHAIAVGSAKSADGKRIGHVTH
jgi:hypothetical protein